jgi:hypothetical protein
MPAVFSTLHTARSRPLLGRLPGTLNYPSARSGSFFQKPVAVIRKETRIAQPRGFLFASLHHFALPLGLRPDSKSRSTGAKRGRLSLRRGEPAQFSNFASNLMMQSDESDPDFARVTSIRLGNDGEVLNVFGDRSQTGAYVVGRLIDPAFISELDGRIFDRAKSAYQSVQIVFRVDYSRGRPPAWSM